MGQQATDKAGLRDTIGSSSTAKERRSEGAKDGTMRDALSVAFAVLLAACSNVTPTSSPAATAQVSAASTATPTASDDPRPPATSSPTFVAMPAITVPPAVGDRTELPSCGDEVVERTPQGEIRDRAARACFWDAWLASRPAEFTSRSLTLEGGSVFSIYRIVGSNAIEIFRDLSGDPFSGPPRWTHVRCNSLILIPVPADEATLYFEGEGCHEA
ncbi:MAG: hypothetical protein ABI534_06685 [Chloroflexota bacterium]